MRTDSSSRRNELPTSGAHPEPPEQQNSTAKRTHPSGTVAGVLLMISTVALGLTAGLLFTFGMAVMPGLAATDDHTYVTAMQSFNDTIQSNWALAVLFVGVLPATVAAAVLDYRSGRGAAARWAAYATVLYLVALLVTAGFNIPMNSDLAAAGNPSTMTDFAIVDRFKTSWVAANALRAALCAVALGCLTRALVLHGRSTATTGRVEGSRQTDR
ncbi:anthrone oxygenase family protein [Streptomyces sp. NBC_00690]|uniref:anthrone oxygenase family protein n=1 Tax=Streptomyces sp. NBC_00690 TaxID=2975808 RepID=UPI002E28EAA7|nr:anthrone oxygenase family protein [Streptomyces sp. NBC_00690]